MANTPTEALMTKPTEEAVIVVRKTVTKNMKKLPTKGLRPVKGRNLV